MRRRKRISLNNVLRLINRWLRTMRGEPHTFPTSTIQLIGGLDGRIRHRNKRFSGGALFPVAVSSVEYRAETERMTGLRWAEHCTSIATRIPGGFPMSARSPKTRARKSSSTISGCQAVADSAPTDAQKKPRHLERGWESTEVVEETGLTLLSLRRGCKPLVQPERPATQQASEGRGRVTRAPLVGGLCSTQGCLGG